MKAIFIALCAILTGTTAMVIITGDINPSRKLGAEHCTWGPSYWCQNLTIAAGCKATTHCVKKVWPYIDVKDDHDSVCEICKNMVEQARDQLESNQTQNDLKAVFEGSCKLMVIKPIVEECTTLVDEFIPELVETLASQMNPSVVCSVSGLCNSPRIDQLILEHEGTLMKVISLEDDELKPNECSKCFTIATRMEEKFKGISRDHLLYELLGLCRNVGSQSDACSNIVIEYFTAIYEHLEANFNAKNICFFSGQCANRFHKHENTTDKEPDVDIRTLSSVGMVDIGDDLPCKLCEQLVGHLRDLLITNTTENEFHHILNGLCGQTKSFADQCTNIVNEYYPEIYDYLVHHLDGNAVCTMGGICPSPGTKQLPESYIPLLSSKATEIGVRIFNEKSKINKHNLGEKGAGIRNIEYSTSEVEAMQLPIERLPNPSSLLGAPNMDKTGQELCTFCEYFLHELQQIITDPKSEEKLKEALGKICKKLPNSIEGTCNEFVGTYGEAVVALLAQEIDPSMICPMMHVCPTKEQIKVFENLNKEWMIESEVKDKPSCPLCLFAVQQLYSVIKDDKTEQNIMNALDKLCHDLPKSLIGQCDDFVESYSKELVDMLLKDLTPQEVCVYIKLCDDKKEAPPIFFPLDKDGEIMTNEIPTYQVEPVKSDEHVNDDVECVLCQYVVKNIEYALKDKSTDDEVKNIVRESCNYFPNSMKDECTNFVDKYATIVINLLSSNTSPKLICSLIDACPSDNIDSLKESVAECAMCQAIMSGIDSILINPTVNTKIENIVAKACNYVAANKYEKCNLMVDVYGQSFINLLKMNQTTQVICGKMAMCSSSDLFVISSEHYRDRRANVDVTKSCTWGDKYVCSSKKTAAECNMEEHCRAKVWSREDSPSSQPAAAIAAANHR